MNQEFRRTVGNEEQGVTTEQYDVEMCAWCYGSGRQGVSERCTVCRGKGKVMVLQPPHRCITCNCTGRSDSDMDVCPRCAGSGWEGVLEPMKDGPKT